MHANSSRRRRSRLRDPDEIFPAPFTFGELLRAAEHVVRHRRGVGYDGIDPRLLDLRPGALKRFVERIFDFLAEGTYRFYAAREVAIDRPGKPPRKVALSVLSDAIVLRAIAEALSPVWQRVPSNVIGGRPGASVERARADVANALTAGTHRHRKPWVLRLDVPSAFPSTLLGLAIDQLRCLSPRADLIMLLMDWHLAQAGRFNKGRDRSAPGGIIQGSPASVFLFAVIAGPAFERALAKAIAWSLWVDDLWAIFRTRDDAERAVFLVTQELRYRGLNLDLADGKSGWWPLEPQSLAPTPWAFLGRRWKRVETASGALWLPLPTDKSVRSLVERSRHWVGRGRPQKVKHLARAWRAAHADCEPAASDTLDDAERSALALVGGGASSSAGSAVVPEAGGTERSDEPPDTEDGDPEVEWDEDTSLLF